MFMLILLTLRDFGVQHPHLTSFLRKQPALQFPQIFYFMLKLAPFLQTGKNSITK